MGLFDFLKKKRQEPEAIPQTPISQEIVKNDDVIVTANTAEISENVRLHPDLEGLVWIGNGKFKNYTDSQNNINRFEVDGLVFTLSFGQETEPSLILNAAYGMF
jgi:hypothetical protein